MRTIGLILFILLVGSYLLGNIYFSYFFSSANLQAPSLWQTVKSAYLQSRILPEKVNFLILGLDQRADNLEQTLLTDSMIFTSFDLKNKTITAISIPRDLWYQSLQTKINALYFYGEEREKGKGMEFVSRELSQMIGQKIDYALLINYSDLVSFVDNLGGVDVSIAKGFTDEKYPNPEFFTSSASISSYITISFKQGLNHLNGERALQFVRSRNSLDPEEGGDLERSSRQIMLLNGVFKRLTSSQIILNPKLLGFTYRFWQEKIQKNMTDSDLLAILFKTMPRFNLKINQIKIPATYEQTGAILVHPPVYKYGQWVWETEGGDFIKLQQFINESVNKTE